MLHVSYREYHAAQRVAERYGVPLTDDLKHGIVREIKRTSRRRPGRGADDRRAWLLHNDRPRNRQRWRVQIDADFFHVIYSVIDKVIITFLPPVEEFAAGGSRRN
jgi:hypothetical protein